MGAAATIAVGCSDSGGAAPAQETNAAAKAYMLLAGVPQHGPVLGEPRAPVTLQFFADLQCHQSRQAMLGALPFLIRRWVRSGQLRIRFRSTKAETLDWLEFRGQQAAALAAGRQGKLWNFVDVFFREQRPEYSTYADESFLRGIAAKSGLDFRRWEEDWIPGPWARRIEADEALAKQAGLEAAPSFLIGRTGERARPLRFFSLEEPGVFEEAIEGLLRA